MKAQQHQSIRRKKRRDYDQEEEAEKYMRKDQAKELKHQGKEGRNMEDRLRQEGRNNTRQGGSKVEG